MKRDRLGPHESGDIRVDVCRTFVADILSRKSSPPDELPIMRARDLPDRL
jgi:hypothetical protein